MSCWLTLYYFVTYIYLTLSWRPSLSYSNRSTDLICKSIDWLIYDRELRHEKVKGFQIRAIELQIQKQPSTGVLIKRYSENMQKVPNIPSGQCFRNASRILNSYCHFFVFFIVGFFQLNLNNSNFHYFIHDFQIEWRSGWLVPELLFWKSVFTGFYHWGIISMLNSKIKE